MEGKQDPVALQLQETDDGDDILERQSEILQRNIRNNNIRHQNEKTALERNNTKLLVRIEELERQHEEVKRQLEATIKATSSPLPEADANPPPRSSATVPTQDATVPFHEYKELERLYNEVLRENDELRRNSEKIATQNSVMKARVKEWSAWVAKDRAKRAKGQKQPAKGKPLKGSQLDMDIPPTPVSTESPIPNVQQTQQPGQDVDDMRRTIAEQASRFLDQHESSLAGHSTLDGLRNERTKSFDSRDPLEGTDDDLPQTFPGVKSETTVHQVPIEISSDPHRPPSLQTNLEESDHHTVRDSPRVTSSQTTQDVDDGCERMEVVEEPVDEPHLDDEEPTIVSEKYLKRKHPAHIEVYQDPLERPTEPTPRVKEELQDTQATPHAVPALLNRASTIDLDEVALHIQTPRKRRRMQDILRNSQLLGNAWTKSHPQLRQERSSSLPLAFVHATGAEALVKKEGQDENVLLDVPDSDPSHAAEDDESPEAAELILTRSPDNPRKAKVLRSRDVNIRAEPHVEHLRPLPRLKRDEYRGAKAVPMVSEDGEETQIRETSPAKMEESRRRFAELYENPPPERKILTSPRTPASSRPTRTTPRTNAGKKSAISTPKLQSTTASTSTRKKEPTAPSSTPQTSAKPSRPGGAAHSLHQRQKKQKSTGPPLRSKQLSRLQLSDFKINPNTNGGLDFAYNEVVRSREARRCLPGCTKPECCGRDLRAMVEAGLNPPLPRSFWDDSQSTRQHPHANEQEEEDHRYLQWSMGISYDRNRVDAMPTVMREDLVIQAKIKLLANQAGKHRYAHQRSRTPPGFWRTDFPATQEIEKDREEARKREREAVEERWREAMSEGGRWLFRDE